MSGKVVIAVADRASQGKTFVFDTHDIFLFGHKSDCHTCIPDDQLVSRHHFVMEVNPPHVCVRDLGSLHGITMTGGGFAGSLLFMPHEQVVNFKYAKPVSDVWSMGESFYNMLIGNFPRPIKPGQNPVEVILNGDIVPLHQRYPHIPKNVATVIDRSVAQDPQDRYQTAGDVLKALAKVLK